MVPVVREEHESHGPAPNGPEWRGILGSSGVREGIRDAVLEHRVIDSGSRVPGFVVAGCEEDGCLAHDRVQPPEEIAVESLFRAELDGVTAVHHEVCAQVAYPCDGLLRRVTPPGMGASGVADHSDPDVGRIDSGCLERGFPPTAGHFVQPTRFEMLEAYGPKATAGRSDDRVMGFPTSESPPDRGRLVFLCMEGQHRVAWTEVAEPQPGQGVLGWGGGEEEDE